MSQSYLHTPSWYQAMTLAERLALGRTRQDDAASATADTDRAGRRLQRWRAQAPFTSEPYFHQRLSSDNIDEHELLSLLAERPTALQERSARPPAWLSDLVDAFTRPMSSYERRLPPAMPELGKLGGFLYAIEPLIVQGRDQLYRGVQALVAAHATLPFDPTRIEEMCFAHLSTRLLTMISRTFVLEMNVARIEERLAGDTSAARFQSFLESLRDREVTLRILQEYPVLARQMTLCIDQWVAYSLEFLAHLCSDWSAIRALFSQASDPGLLCAIKAGAGDTHREGRSVLIAEFSAGFQIVYKPRSLAVDVHFQELLTTLNGWGAQPALRTLAILDRGSHGWVEYLATKGCTSAAEVHRFYERQGSYLALLYALQATDFHAENLIAVGEHPMLVDLEALFHPPVNAINMSSADSLPRQRLIYSVLSVGLLPERFAANDEYSGYDSSGLGAQIGQLSLVRVPRWEHVGTDQMRLTSQRHASTEAPHRPRLNRDEVDVVEYSDAIIAGFTRMYRLLLAHRDQLLAEDGPLVRFASDEIRVILRPTWFYSLLLHDSFHPDVLRNALDRERLFDRLWFQIKDHPYLAKVIPAEREDLWRGDIPIFTTRPDARALSSGSGQRLADFFDEPSIVFAQRRLEQLGDADLAQQLWFTQAALSTLSISTHAGPWTRVSSTRAQALATPRQFLEAACRVGDRLVALAMRDGQEVDWIGLSLVKQRYWSLVPLGLDLGNGLAGVALFLSYLGARSGQQQYTELARATQATIERRLDPRSLAGSIGAFEGVGGIIYTLTHLGALWQEPALFRKAEALVEQLPPLIEQDLALDIVGGAAGCIGALLCLYRHAPAQRTLAVAVDCGERLVACAQPMGQGVGWKTQISTRYPLSGFSHGAAGIAMMLLELAALSGVSAFREYALAALQYERSLFVADANNWRDLRQVQDIEQRENKFMTAWCHGAPGIGLARLHARKYIDDELIRAEIEAALKTTLAHGFGSNHSLCHGDLGNLELLLHAAALRDHRSLSSQAQVIASTILESINQNGCLCGVPTGIETPGLITGLAGIGYGLLRVAAVEEVPSVLTLAPPVLNPALSM